MPKHVPELPGVEPSTFPFSKVVEANGFVFLAGQVGDEPGTPGPVAGGITAETRATLENIGRLLRAVGLDFTDVVRVTVFLVDFDEFGAMNEVYREYFADPFPARATVGVTRLASTYRVEMDVTAAR